MLKIFKVRYSDNPDKGRFMIQELLMYDNGQKRFGEIIAYFISSKSNT